MRCTASPARCADCGGDVVMTQSKCCDRASESARGSANGQPADEPQIRDDDRLERARAARGALLAALDRIEVAATPVQATRQHVACAYQPLGPLHPAAPRRERGDHGHVMPPALQVLDEVRRPAGARERARRRQLGQQQDRSSGGQGGCQYRADADRPRAVDRPRQLQRRRLPARCAGGARRRHRGAERRVPGRRFRLGGRQLGGRRAPLARGACTALRRRTSASAPAATAAPRPQPAGCWRSSTSTARSNRAGTPRSVRCWTAIPGSPSRPACCCARTARRSRPPASRSRPTPRPTAAWRALRAAARRPTPIDVAAASGALMMVRRDEFLALGGFYEPLFMYGEEADYCLRVPGRVVLHPGARSATRWATPPGRRARCRGSTTPPQPARNAARHLPPPAMARAVATSARVRPAHARAAAADRRRQRRSRTGWTEGLRAIRRERARPPAGRAAARRRAAS